MGVQGLWQLLSPCGRRVSIENLKDKRLAVDVSIWLVQFVRAMKGSDGKVLKNAHLRGTFFRLCKLLFNRVKPIIVFDGGAPVLKRRTVMRRTNQRQKEEAKFRAAAQRLLLNQMRLIKQAESTDDSGHLANDFVEPTAASRSTNDTKSKHFANASISNTPIAAPSATSAHGGAAAAASANKGMRSRFTRTLQKVEKRRTLERRRNAGLLSSQIERRRKRMRNSRKFEFAEHVLDASGEIDREVFVALDPKLQQEVVENLEVKHRTENRQRYLPVAGNASDFSNAQLNSFLSASRVRGAIRKARFGQGSSESSRAVASESDRTFVVTGLDSSSFDTLFASEERTKAKSSTAALRGRTVRSDAGARATDLSSSVDPSRETSMMLATCPAFLRKSYAVSSSRRPPNSMPNASSDFKTSASSMMIDLTATKNSDDVGQDRVTESSRRTAKKYEAGDSASHHASRSPVEFTVSTGDDGSTHIVARLDTKNLDHSMGLPRGLLEGKHRQRDQNSARSNDDDDEEEEEEEDSSDWEDVTPCPPPKEEGVVQFNAVAASEASSRTNVSNAPDDMPPRPILKEDTGGGFIVSDDDDDDGDHWDDASNVCVIETAEPLPDLGNDEGREEVVVEKEKEKSGDGVYDQAVKIASSIAPWAGRVVSRVVGSTSASRGKTTASVSESSSSSSNVRVRNISSDEGPKFSRMTDSLRARSSTEKDATEARVDASTNMFRVPKSLRREPREDSVTASMRADVIELLRIMGIPYVVSPCEAEAQCATLERLRLVDGIISNDSDTFLFGGGTVYRNFFEHAKFVEEYRANDVRTELGLSRDRLVALGLLLGCDYTDGIRGVGIVNACEILAAFGESDARDEKTACSTDIAKARLYSALSGFKTWVESIEDPLASRLGSRKRLSQSEEAELSPRERFMYKHRSKRSKWVVTEGFPSKQVVDAFFAPSSDVSTQAFSWAIPDSDALVKWCVEKLEWSRTKAETSIQDLIRATRSNAAQPTLGAWFTSYPDTVKVAEVKSNRLRDALAALQGRQ